MDQEDFSEGATANDGLDDEVGESDILVELGVDKGGAVVAARGQFVVLVGRRAVGCGGGRVGERLVEVLGAQAEAIGRELVLACLRVVLRSAVLLQLSRHAVYRQVLVHQMEVARLYLLKHIVTKFANEPIIVFIPYVYYELFIAGFGTLR